MREPMRYLGEHATLPISCIPNAGLPLNTGIGEAVYPLEPAPMAAALARVRATSSACASSAAAAARRPSISSAIVAAVQEGRGAARRRAEHRGDARAARRRRRCARSTLHQDPPPLLIGERVNAQGSRKVKRLLLAEDYEGIVDVAREQVEAGAHVLDVCVALTERARRSRADVEGREAALDERRDAAHDRLDRGRRDRGARSSTSPAARSSTPSTWRTGASASTACVPLAKKHGAAVVALTIDEVGMAKTRERKLEVARKIHDIVVGRVRPARRRISSSTRSPSRSRPATPSGSTRRIETIEGIRLIKRELPGVFTSLGVSQRELRARRRRRAPCSTRCSCTTAWRRGSTWRS